MPKHLQRLLSAREAVATSDDGMKQLGIIGVVAECLTSITKSRHRDHNRSFHGVFANVSIQQ